MAKKPTEPVSDMVLSGRYVRDAAPLKGDSTGHLTIVVEYHRNWVVLVRIPPNLHDDCREELKPGALLDIVARYWGVPVPATGEPVLIPMLVATSLDVVAPAQEVSQGAEM